MSVSIVDFRSRKDRAIMIARSVERSFRRGMGMKTDETVRNRLENLSEEKQDVGGEIEKLLSAQIEILEWVLDGNETVSGERVARLKLSRTTPFESVAVGFRDSGQTFYVDETTDVLGQYELIRSDQIPQI